MKKRGGVRIVILIIVVLILLVGGYFLFSGEEEKKECAGEGEITLPMFYGCCEGLSGFDRNPQDEDTDKAYLCYDSSQGIPECKLIGSESEGWYYSEDDLITWDNCG